MVNNDFLKNVPKGVGKVVEGIFSMMMVDMSDRPGAADPKKEFKTLCHNLGKLYDEKLQIQDPNSFASKAGRFTGEMLAFGAIGKVVRVAEGVSLFARASEGGLYGFIAAETHDTNKVAGVAFGFAGGGAVHGIGFLFRKPEVVKPLLDRALVRPQGFGNQKRILDALNNPAYRGGIGNPLSPMSEMLAVQPKNLVGNNFSKILPIEQGGRTLGKFYYSEGSFKHFHDLVLKGVHKGKLDRPYMRSIQTIKEIIHSKPPMPDPKGTPGFLWWKVPGKFRETEGYWELLLDSENNQICHFNFKS